MTADTAADAARLLAALDAPNGRMHARLALRKAAPDLARAVIRLEAERDAYKRAKAENDERFMLERDEARAEADRYRLALESLTPGGSEYHRNPERCVAAVQEMKREPNRIVSQLRAEIEQLRAPVPEPLPACGVPIGGAAWCPCALPAGHDGHHASAARLVLDAAAKP